MAIYQITCNARFGGVDEMRNIHYYDSGPSALTDPEVDQVAFSLLNTYETHLQSLFDEAVTVYGASVRRVDEPNLPPRDYLLGVNEWSGGGPGNSLPSQTAALVTWKGVSVYPRTTRSYLFPFATSAIGATGTLLSAVVDDLQAWGAAMLELSYAGGNVDKVAVRWGGTPRVVVEHNDVFTVQVKPVLATQRRRTRGVGI